MCKDTKKLQKSYIQIWNLQHNTVLFKVFIDYLFQIGNIQTVVSSCFLIIFSFQNFQLIIDAVGLFADTHLDVFLKHM